MNKKSKKKNKIANSQANAQSTQEKETDTDDTGDSQGIEDDQEFANKLLGVQRNAAGASSLLNGQPTPMDDLDIFTPPTVEDKAPWSFLSEPEQDMVEGTSNVEKDTTKSGNTTSEMGLDSFIERPKSGSESPSLSHSNDSSGRSSCVSQSPTKFSTVTSRHSSITRSPAPANVPLLIPFPLQDEFDFKLACRYCFTKTGEGLKGYNFINNTHNCLHDILIVKKRNTPAWVKIRYRPEAKGYYGAFRICAQFKEGKPCKVSEDKCTFPHHQAELKLWSMDRDGTFSMENFITQCRANKIYNSESLVIVKSKQPPQQQYIPGLNYATDKRKSAAQKPTTDHAAENHFSGQTTSWTANVSGNEPSWMPTIKQPVTVAPVPQVTSQSNILSTTAALAQALQQTYQFTQSIFMQPTVNVSQPPPLLAYPTQWKRDAPTGFHEPAPEEVESQKQVAILENPLSHSHDAFITCQYCCRPTIYPGVYEYKKLVHKCEETMLCMTLKNGTGPFMRVRERKHHRDFPGNYILCNSVRYNNPTFCKYGEENCSFAHNEVEKILWTLEKDGKFNIFEFLVQNRKMASGKGFNLMDILAKHGGYFEFICRGCYYGSPPKISYKQANQSMCVGYPPHSWVTFQILAHIGVNGVVTLVNPRGFLHKTAFFKICKWLQYCKNRVNAECRFAHSVIERDIWMLERDSNMTRPEIVLESKKLHGIKPQAATGNTEPVSQSTAPSVPAAFLSSSVADVKTLLAVVPPSETVALNKPSDGSCPVVLEVCETCWKRGQKSLQQTGKDRCQNDHANWSCNIVYLLSPSMKELRPLPRKIPSGLNFIICNFVKEGKKCAYPGPSPCQFAHSTEELEAWKYMCVNNLKTVKEISNASKALQKVRAESVKPKISGQSVVSSSTSIVRPAMPVTNIYTLYCHYCGVCCNSQKQWQEHCASEKHTFNVNSDKEHQWNYRQPPWSSGQIYKICERHIYGMKCQYSHMPEMYNLCPYAHSQDELDEWNERSEWRLMKREMARHEKVFSYMDEMLDKYERSLEPIQVISESVEGVIITTHGDLHIYKDKKDVSYIWRFEIVTMKRLEKVALLYNRDRLHFSLLVNEKTCQIAEGECFCENKDSTTNQLIYSVLLKFVGGMFGSFLQWILFDFGTEPVLCRKITVEIGNQSAHEKVRQLRQQLQFDRWTSHNRQIIRHESMEKMEEELLTKYKEPVSTETVVTQMSIVTELNRHNYVPKMHRMLELEEMSRHKIIASYNLCVNIECKKAIEEETHVFAKPGELFARVPLQESLTEDTDAGILILTSVRKVLVAPQSSKDQNVYEAVIVREENFNYDGRGRDFIYLCLSPKCVKELSLQSGMSVPVEIQFQMDRLFFCRMHYAVDHLCGSDIVFPDVPKINPLRNEIHNLKISSSVLNPDQMSAVRHIVAQRTNYTPPFVLYGPFGTGKTETIAQATMVLLKETRDTRILICAQSNSAADIYITKHFDTFLKRSGAVSQLLRVYYTKRRMFTVSQDVKKYCLLSSDGDSFRMPAKEDIEKCRVIVTTVEMSVVLTYFGFQGMFTHIFIDEAAQTLECDSLMPISLATEKTCIVLAGDHQQISPKVYSEEAHKQKFDKSLLERLFNYYESYSSLISTTSPLNILLSINYRTKMEILRFISAVFYGGPDVLKSESNIPSVLSITPLVFYAVQGQEEQDSASISYKNVPEVYEIVERVSELFEKWPEEWGSFNAKEIGVVSPYFDQVVLIRKELKKRNAALKDVVVEKVQAIQGREFRAVFITTVRTRHLIEAEHVQTHKLIDGEGETGNFGFLSDYKLLNTAMTRAQSLVVVVGDPVALCAFGECMNLWRSYLKHCQNMGSLYPQNHTLEVIKQQVLNLQQTLQVTEQLKHLSIENRRFTEKNVLPNTSSTPQLQGYSSVLKPTTTNTSQPSATFNVAGSLEYSRSKEPLYADVSLNGKDKDLTYTDSSVKGKGKDLAYTDSSVNGKGKDLAYTGSSVPVSNWTVNRNPIKPLTSNLSRVVGAAPLTPIQLKKVETCIEIGEDFTFDANDVLLQLAKQESSLGKMDLDVGSIGVTEMSGHAVLCSKENCGSKEFHCMYDMNRLNTLLAQDTDRYQKCVLYINTSICKAVVMDGYMKDKTIEIPSRWMCGMGNNNDEVVVELMKNEHKDIGRVVGVLKSAFAIKNRYIICKIDDNCCGVMVPVHDALSPMFNITYQTNLQQNLNGNVSVYRFTKTKKVQFSHFEKMSLCNEKLYVVRFLRWDRGLPLPLCICMGVINSCFNEHSCTSVLELEHGINRLPYPAVGEVGSTVLSAAMRSGRLDLRERYCLTVNPVNIEEINLAFSIDQLEDGGYQVGVHVTDVAAFVNKNSDVDKEAQRRGRSIFPVNGEPIPMLPLNLCSLKCNEDKLAVSVLFTVESTGEIIDFSVQKTVINCKSRLTFKEAEEYLNDPFAQEDYLKSCISALFHLSLIWRRKRLGNAVLVHEDNSTKTAPHAHQLVHELVVMTEFHIAQFVSSRFPDVLPLLIQSPPKEATLNIWRQEHAADAVNSIALTKPFLNATSLETCNCGVACTHTVNYVRQFNIPKREFFEVMSILWDCINEALVNGNLAAIEDIIVTPENHPQLVVALWELKSILEAPRLVCASDVKTEQGFHYSYNCRPYTLFTQPLSSYIDIVIQRLVLAQLDSLPCPYSQSEIQSLCRDVNVSCANSRTYEDQTLLLHMCFSLLYRPLVVNAVILKLNMHNICVCFPSLYCLMSEYLIDFEELGICREPESVNNYENIILKWQERVYDYGALQKQTAIGSTFGEINPDRFIYKIPAGQWQRLLIAVREQNEETKQQKLLSAMENVRKHVFNPVLEKSYIHDVMSEVFKMGSMKHLAEFSLKIHRTQVLQMQLSAMLTNGVMVPYVQLVNLTPQLDICLQHIKQTSECFATSTNVKEIPLRQIDDIKGYQNYWTPILETEAACNSVESNRRIFIHNLPIEWRKDKLSSNTYTAQFSIPYSFLKARLIKVVSDLEWTLLFKPENSIYCKAYFADFLCIRYKNLNLPEISDLNEEIAILKNDGTSVTWVGHSIVTDVAISNDILTFKLKLLQSDVPLPLLHVQSKTATVEFIMRTEADRMQLYALQSLQYSLDLTRNIILGRAPSNQLTYKDIELLLKSTQAMSPVLKPSQEAALQQALSQPFTCISGPAGSGKSLLAAKLACLYSQRNLSTQGKKQQVLVCAPSEVVLDTLTGFLESFRNSVQVVRVYGNDVENVIHPPPRHIATSMTSEVSLHLDQIKSYYTDMSLYVHVRGVDSVASKLINEYEKLFSQSPDNVSDDQYDSYVQLLYKCEVAVLQKADIILCTCISSGLPKITSATNVCQIIIDDANAASTTELLVPLCLNRNLEQITIFGDVNQLSPTVKSAQAQALGFGESIMKAYVNSAVYLDLHFRVHEEIVRLPSEYRYNYQPKSGSMTQRQPSVLNWPAGRSKPLAFCNLEGVEKILALGMGCPKQQAIYNVAQADFVVRVVKSLVSRYRVTESNIAVVCLTKAQCTVIKSKLLLPDNQRTCCTIQEIIGKEYDYVILCTVRSLHPLSIEKHPDRAWLEGKLGQLTNHGLVTVALTRARKGLIIVGNAALLRLDPMWCFLLESYEKENMLVTEDFIRTSMSL